MYANLFYDKKKKGTSAHLQPSLPFQWYEKKSLQRNGHSKKLWMKSALKTSTSGYNCDTPFYIIGCMW